MGEWGLAGPGAQLAGCQPSKHQALGFIPSTGINQVWWQRPEITQPARSKERSQRALSWVPSFFRPTMLFPAGSFWAGEQRVQERMWRDVRREKAEIHPGSMKLRTGGQSQGEHQRLGDHVCLAAQDSTRRLISCRFTPPRDPPKL